MAKYTIHSTKADWEKLYKAVEKKMGIEYVDYFKKKQSFDTACTDYAIYANDYKLVELK